MNLKETLSKSWEVFKYGTSHHMRLIRGLLIVTLMLLFLFIILNTPIGVLIIVLGCGFIYFIGWLTETEKY